MLNIQYIRENADKIKEAILNKNLNLDLDQLFEFDDQRKKIQTENEIPWQKPEKREDRHRSRLKKGNN